MGEYDGASGLVRALVALQQAEGAVLGVHQITEQGGQRLLEVGDDQPAEIVEELVECFGPDVGWLDPGEEVPSPLRAHRDHLPFGVGPR
ncbi:MAG: hypothetical protein ACRDTE_02490, partial [Pseudonocardiaceae bacterium]